MSTECHEKFKTMQFGTKLYNKATGDTVLFLRWAGSYVYVGVDTGDVESFPTENAYKLLLTEEECQAEKKKNKWAENFPVGSSCVAINKERGTVYFLKVSGHCFNSSYTGIRAGICLFPKDEYDFFKEPASGFVVCKGGV
jgi:hypothetical protein